LLSTSLFLSLMTLLIQAHHQQIHPSPFDAWYFKF
jgi:hypothetical protein